MTKQSSDHWEHVSQARNLLDEQLRDNADVCYVDIGHAQNDGLGDGPSLRVHVCNGYDQNSFPYEIDGVPVVITGSDDDA